jgi:hypothetical protein
VAEGESYDDWQMVRDFLLDCSVRVRIRH